MVACAWALESKIVRGARRLRSFLESRIGSRTKRARGTAGMFGLQHVRFRLARSKV